MKVKDREKQTTPVPHHTVVHQLLAALETACRNVEDKLYRPTGFPVHWVTCYASRNAVESCRHVRDLFAFEEIPAYAVDKPLKEAASLRKELSTTLRREKELIKGLEDIDAYIGDMMERLTAATQPAPRKKKVKGDDEMSDDVQDAENEANHVQ